MLGFLGTGTVVEVLKHRGTWHRSSDLLNRAMNTGAILCVLSRDKSSEKYKGLGRYSQFTVCSMCSKSLRSYVYTHTILSNNRTDRIAQTITHRHFTSPFTGAILIKLDDWWLRISRETERPYQNICFILHYQQLYNHNINNDTSGKCKCIDLLNSAIRILILFDGHRCRWVRL